ncbi:MAG: 30S ribosomal protein S19 [Nanoarchaeota archaeon]|nr:30S ribosomal protein S19 [Nanoarchaeota archaeon]
MELVKKEFTYRGKTIEELKQMNLREFARLLKANERRTVLRQTDELEIFISKAGKKIEKRKPVRTHLRHLIVVPRMIDMSINVYNGKEFVPVKIMAEMLGHRFGEFSVTRLKVKHGAAGIGATRSSASLSVK